MITGVEHGEEVIAHEELPPSLLVVGGVWNIVVGVKGRV